MNMQEHNIEIIVGVTGLVGCVATQTTKCLCNEFVLDCIIN